MNDGCKLQYFYGKSDFTFFLNHFTGISYFSPVNWWNFVKNRFETILFCSQYDISGTRNTSFILNIFDGIINDSSSSKSAVKSPITLLINHSGYPALLHFTVIALMSLPCYFSRSMQIPWNGVLFISFLNFRNSRNSFFILFSIYLRCY